MIKKSRNLHKTSFSPFDKSLWQPKCYMKLVWRARISSVSPKKYVSMQQFSGFYRQESSHYSLYGQPNFIQMVIALKRETYWCLRHLEMCHFYSNIHSKATNSTKHVLKRMCHNNELQEQTMQKDDKTSTFIQLACSLSLAMSWN